MIQTKQPSMKQSFDARYCDAPDPSAIAGTDGVLRSMAARGSCRSFTDRPVPHDVQQTLCAIALASPTKSDLQQRDIILIQSADLRAQLSEMVSGQAWVADAPLLAVFCGNNRRQRLLHEWQDVPFANDHLDAFFNATADAAIALGAFVTAAEAIGLGCCPISAVRNEAAAVSELLELPAHVFPMAGLAIGYPQQTPEIAQRLPLGVTCHFDAYSEVGLQKAIADYDKSRAAVQPYQNQRFVNRFGVADDYAWSEDKVRQYSEEERAEFGAYIRAQGFRLG